jgi:hypothetical protein
MIKLLERGSHVAVVCISTALLPACMVVVVAGQ